ncbi:hypothetical protein ACH4MA_18645 [Streptomyces roseolus]|uniref:hypothetical protein n=1 Tax=Streptomyces roseolus TaxID=67358 RepID=UPI00363F0547
MRTEAAAITAESGGRERLGRILIDWLTTTDHKKIGHLCLATSFAARSPSSCPPPRHNFTAVPRIRSESPAFDLHHPEFTGYERMRLTSPPPGR